MISHPPAWAEHWQSSDPDEIVAKFATSGRHRREVVGAEGFLYHATSAALGDVVLGWGGSNAPQRIEATPAVSIVHIPLTVPISYRVGKRHLESRPGRAVYLPSERTYTAAYLPGRWFALTVTTALLEDRRATLAGRVAPLAGPQEFDIPAQAFAREIAALSSLPAAPDGEGRLALGRVREAIVDRLAGQLNREIPATKSGEIAVERTRRVEEWVDAHLAEHLGLGQLCAVAGIEARGLQKSFLQRRGMTPLRWVRERRLAASRHQLLHAGPEDQVTAIALRCGFTHLGRYAIAFRRRYGQSPSEVLAAVQAR